MPTVPEGFCNSLNNSNWVQTLVNLIAQGVAILDGSGFSVVLNQSTAPGPTDRDKLWRDTDTGRVYNWDGGAWVTPNPEEPSGNARRLWAGSLSDLISYDGGSAGAVGTNSGPMWEEDTDMAGRSPMHPGSIPTANPAKILAVGENYGEGAHAQTTQEVGPHTHPLVTEAGITNADGSIDVVNTGVGTAGLMIGLTGPQTTPLSVQTNAYTTTQEPMPVLHPIRGLYVIKRTGRLNYVGS